MHWHTKQFGTLIVSLFLSIIAIGTIICFTVGDLEYIIPIFIIVPIIVLILFYQLEIAVTDEFIYAKLGVGLIRKKIYIKDISFVSTVKNSALAGWGIRILPEYTLYNVSGFNAVEITLKNKRRKFRLGIESPDSFVNVINMLTK